MSTKQPSKAEILRQLREQNAINNREARKALGLNKSKKKKRKNS